MKKLYENIDDIHIKGDIAQLSEMVRTMDRALQNIADNSEQLIGYLSKYSAANKGAQYSKVVKTSMRLRNSMFSASQELNDMQKQIVAYQNKIYRYEDMHESAQSPNPYLVSKKQVNVDVTITQFTRSEMIELSASLRNYSERVIHHIKTIKEKKNEMASVWRDSQYKDFSEFIDGITQDVMQAIKVFEDYVGYLEEKIKELS